MGALRTLVRIGVMAFLCGSCEYLAYRYDLFNAIYTHVPRFAFSIIVLVLSYIIAKRLVG